MISALRKLLLWSAAVLAAVFAVFVVLCAGQTWLVELPFMVVLGWFFYLHHVVPQLKPDPWVVGTGVLCLAGVVLGAHAFLRWLPPTGAQPRPWRRTLGVVGLVVLLFAAGIATTGIVHQTAWLVTSPERFIRTDRDDYPRLVSGNNLKQIGLAAQNHEDAMNPPELPRSTFDATGRAMHSWQTALLPYLEQGPLYQQIDRAKPWSDPANAQPMSSWVKVFLHPAIQADAVSGYGISHYAGNARVVMGDAPRTLQSFPAGTSNTILAGEVASGFRAWGDPLNARDPHRGGFAGPNGRPPQFVMLDGSVRAFDPRELAELLGKVPE